MKNKVLTRHPRKKTKQLNTHLYTDVKVQGEMYTQMLESVRGGALSLTQAGYPATLSYSLAPVRGRGQITLTLN